MATPTRMRKHVAEAVAVLLGVLHPVGGVAKLHDCPLEAVLDVLVLRDLLRHSGHALLRYELVVDLLGGAERSPEALAELVVRDRPLDVRPCRLGGATNLRVRLTQCDHPVSLSFPASVPPSITPNPPCPRGRGPGRLRWRGERRRGRCRAGGDEVGQRPGLHVPGRAGEGDRAHASLRDRAAGGERLAGARVGHDLPAREAVSPRPLAAGGEGARRRGRAARREPRRRARAGSRRPCASPGFAGGSTRSATSARAIELRQRLTLLLSRRTEYQLLCRWEAAAEMPDACSEPRSELQNSSLTTGARGVSVPRTQRQPRGSACGSRVWRGFRCGVEVGGSPRGCSP